MIISLMDTKQHWSVHVAPVHVAPVHGALEETEYFTLAALSLQ